MPLAELYCAAWLMWKGETLLLKCAAVSLWLFIVWARSTIIKGCNKIIKRCHLCGGGGWYGSTQKSSVLTISILRRLWGKNQPWKFLKMDGLSSERMHIFLRGDSRRRNACSIKATTDILELCLSSPFLTSEWTVNTHTHLVPLYITIPKFSEHDVFPNIQNVCIQKSDSKAFGAEQLEFC